MKRLLIANIYRLHNLYLRNGLRSRSNTEPDFHPSWVNHLCCTSRRAIKRRRRRDRRTLHDRVHFDPRRQGLVRSQVGGLRSLSEAAHEAADLVPCDALRLIVPAGNLMGNATLIVFPGRWP
jgi:hypothetical protein